MSIALARSDQQVTSIEINDSRVAMARHNARVYGVEDHIDFRVADISAEATLEDLPGEIDTVFLDPPWGAGPGDYIRRPSTYLADMHLAGRDLRSLLRAIPCREIMMRLPPNFDIGIVRQSQGEKIAYVTRKGFLHWYFIRLPKDEFIALPDRSPEGLSMEAAREGIVPWFVAA